MRGFALLVHATREQLGHRLHLGARRAPHRGGFLHRPSGLAQALLQLFGMALQLRREAERVLFAAALDRGLELGEARRLLVRGVLQPFERLRGARLRGVHQLRQQLAYAGDQSFEQSALARQRALQQLCAILYPLEGMLRALVQPVLGLRALCDLAA